MIPADGSIEGTTVRLPHDAGDRAQAIHQAVEATKTAYVAQPTELKALEKLTPVEVYEAFARKIAPSAFLVSLGRG